ncbi:hypothetical protein SAMN05216251_102403 [Actinacidiphila alni]|uniref:Uncharacterized protein n=1 Tax=Actinacidiphila alni TaxID=380248 RepID=A0A1I1ZCL1_9ACTN|nr:hypothetical protein [Actinacidiphila alni]SFE29425.1 hypothetical protein SAMN05216251_102403 [Actinacidiphila alni]
MRKTPKGRAALVLLTAAAALAAGTGGAGAMGVPRPTPVERLMESRLTVTYAADGPQGATAPPHVHRGVRSGAGPGRRPRV